MEVSTALVALYLRGLEGRPWEPPVRAWPAVEAALRRASPDMGGLAAVLAEAGFWCESACLEVPRLLARAEALVDSGRALSAACPAFPARWLSALGAAAPPSVWSLGSPFSLGGVSVAGSRQLGRSASAFARGVGCEAARLGFAVVSGGAVGADRLCVGSAAMAGASCMEVWPCGLECPDFRPSSGASWLLSVAAPRERFSSALAMERNALLYAASPLSVVVDCRLKEGGSWHGAVGAMRRRLSRLAVRACPGSAGLRALEALGAFPLEHPSLLGEAHALALSEPVWAQRSLFGAA